MIFFSLATHLQHALVMDLNGQHETFCYLCDKYIEIDTKKQHIKVSWMFLICVAGFLSIIHAIVVLCDENDKNQIFDSNSQKTKKSNIVTNWKRK